MNLPELGVGLVYWPGLEPLFESGNHALSVIEIEPQGYWFENPAQPQQPYRIDQAALERLQRIPLPKIVHGVGFPVGGTRVPDERHLAPLCETINALDAAWASEHLSFNRARNGSDEFNTGFLLPPLQTPAGARAAAATIRHVAQRVPVPFAIETNVSYLRPQRGEMSDGAFVATVTEAADCGILLDLHNVWTNERNGRQTLRAFLDEIPLERVWEVHLAGGAEYRGYWLDAHSGVVPEALLEIAAEVLPRLPNLRALMFEILPPFIPVVGLDLIQTQMEKLQELWKTRRNALPRTEKYQRAAPLTDGAADCAITPRGWEDTLGGLVIGRPAATPLARELDDDPGVTVLRHIAATFRSGILVDNLKLTTRLLILSLSEERTQQLLREFWQASPPELFAIPEAQAFARFLRTRRLNVPHLYDVLDYELALLQMSLTGARQLVRFECDPLPLLQSLGAGQLPVGSVLGNYELEVTPD